jgi:hypothetical protein
MFVVRNITLYEPSFICVICENIIEIEIQIEIQIQIQIEILESFFLFK